MSLNQIEWSRVSAPDHPALFIAIGAVRHQWYMILQYWLVGKEIISMIKLVWDHCSTRDESDSTSWGWHTVSMTGADPRAAYIVIHSLNHQHKGGQLRSQPMPSRSALWILGQPWLPGGTEYTFADPSWGPQLGSIRRALGSPQGLLGDGSHRCRTGGYAKVIYRSEWSECPYSSPFWLHNVRSVD